MASSRPLAFSSSYCLLRTYEKKVGGKAEKRPVGVDESAIHAVTSNIKQVLATRKFSLNVSNKLLSALTTTFFASLRPPF